MIMSGNTEVLNQQLFDVIKKSLWNDGAAKADEAIFREMTTHTIAPLAAPILPELSLTPELFSAWDDAVVKTVVKYRKYLRQQSFLPVSVPYVILKGTAAAQYYPYPEYRVMGDIDIMTRREDHEKACAMMLADGYTEISEENYKWHREFIKNGISVEVHAYFAVLNNQEYAKYLDHLIVDHINSSHLLPDLVNGLVVLEHISHHLEDGLGLRQIIDWMMFVHRCLPDEQWPEFREMAQHIGLEKLAVVLTRMCEMYLGLPERGWCADADEALCEKLMAYILSCGNFGRKAKIDDALYHGNTLTKFKTAKVTFGILQQRGVLNWPAAQRHPVLRPLAWMYQVGRYLKRGVFRPHPIGQLKAELAVSRQLDVLFDSLGVKRLTKGIAKYDEYKKS